MKKKLFIIPVVQFMLITFIVTVNANTIPKDIVTCFKTGNAEMLSTFFYKNIELQILDDENVYSKTQAEQIVKRFFQQNKPVDFEIRHQSGKDGSEYAIGILHTNKANFRVYFLIKTQEDKQYIHQLSIKKENE